MFDIKVVFFFSFLVRIRGFLVIVRNLGSIECVWTSVNFYFI
jgi:hypothetical protein